MRKIIIIGTYPNNPYKEDMLNECIEKVKPLGYDIMLVSHYPISFETQTKVDYVIYDKENILVEDDLTPNWTFNNDAFKVIKYNGGGHILAVTKNIFNGINLSNNLKYDFFFFMECDNIFDIDDLIKIDVLRNSMFIEGKNMLLFGYNNKGYNIYETLMFGGSPSWFIENINLPTKKSDLDNRVISLERIFYNDNKNKNDKYYIVPKSSKEFFSKSEINKEFNKFIVEVFGSNRENELYLFCINFGFNPNPIKIKINDGDFRELCPGCWYLNKARLENTLKVEIVCNHHTELREFDLTARNLLQYLNRGFINFIQ